MRQQEDFLEPGLQVPPTVRQTDDDKEPDGGYGWVCVVCQLLITASTWGVNGVSSHDFLSLLSLDSLVLLSEYQKLTSAFS